MDLRDVLLVTHRNCMDGSACAAIFVLAGGLRENIVFTNPGHHESDDLVEELLETWDGLILLADVSISSELASRITNLNIVLLDHHLSALPLRKFDWCEIEVNNQRSGAKMLYDWLVKHGCYLRPYKEFIDAVDDQDRWIKNIPESDNVAALHDMLGQELFIDRFIKNPSLDLSSNENYLLRIEQYRKHGYIDGVKNNITIRNKIIDGKEYKIAYVLANRHQSALGEVVYSDPLLSVDVVVMVGERSISMRARPNIDLDLSKIAQLNGGGGHKSAAGCSTSMVLGADLLDLVIDRLKFE